MNDQTAQRGAPLSRGSGGRERDAAHRQIEIGTRRDDRGVVATKFEDRATEPCGDDGSDFTAHAGGSGGRHERCTPIGHERLAHFGVARHDLEDLLGCAGGSGGAASQNVGRHRGDGRDVGWFPDDRVAADHRERGVPGPDRHRKIERRDDRDRSVRMPGLGEAMARALGGDAEAVQLARESDREVADVNHLLHFTQCLGADLAGLDLHESREIVLVPAEFFAEEADHLATARSGNITPRREDVGREGERGIDVRCGEVLGQPVVLETVDR